MATPTQNLKTHESTGFYHTGSLKKAAQFPTSWSLVAWKKTIDGKKALKRIAAEQKTTPKFLFQVVDRKNIYLNPALAVFLFPSLFGQLAVVPPTPVPMSPGADPSEIALLKAELATLRQVVEKIQAQLNLDLTHAPLGPWLFQHNLQIPETATLKGCSDWITDYCEKNGLPIFRVPHHDNKYKPVKAFPIVAIKYWFDEKMPCLSA